MGSQYYEAVFVFSGIYLVASFMHFIFTADIINPRKKLDYSKTTVSEIISDRRIIKASRRELYIVSLFVALFPFSLSRYTGLDNWIFISLSGLVSALGLAATASTVNEPFSSKHIVSSMFYFAPGMLYMLLISFELREVLPKVSGISIATIIALSIIPILILIKNKFKPNGIMEITFVMGQAFWIVINIGAVLTYSF